MTMSNLQTWTQVQNTYTRYTNEIYPEERDLLAATAIDAWKSHDPEESGKVIAEVLLSRSGDIIVSYHDQRARFDALVQEKIQETISQLQHLYENRTKDNEVVPYKTKPALTQATLSLPPEILSLWNSCLGKTADEIASLFGAIDNNPELQFDFGNNYSGYITLWIPETADQKTCLLLDLFHGSVPAAKGILLSDNTELTGEYSFETEEYGTLTMLITAAPEKTRIGKTFTFHTDDSSPKLAAYNNQPCKVLNTLEPLTEYEPLAIGELMYHVQFSDGSEHQVYDSELSFNPIPEKNTNLETLISSAATRRHDQPTSPKKENIQPKQPRPSKKEHTPEQN